VRSITPRSRAAWRAWLADHHATATAVRVVFHRKAAGKPTLGYADAVEVALCFGWVDGVKHKLDDTRYSHRFTPRRPGSTWSAINRERVARMVAAREMTPAGQAAVDRARADGTYLAPNRAPVPTEVPAELTAALAANVSARATFDALAPSHRKQWLRWIAAAKQAETRARRAAKAAAALAKGGKRPSA
jgi:uncharacterized protein YdeI (YjbR/CyaY-like superfamily)